MASHITTFSIWDEEAVLQAGVAEYIVDLKRYNTEGFFSLQATVASAGAGSVDFTWAISNDGVSYVTPSTVDPIFDDMVKTSGPGSDGIDIASFDPVLGAYLKIIATENNVAAVTISAVLAIQ
jgi:hypothetical protein